MGYACPVCGDPQADATHLANHLAFTALARGGDHEAWLDEQVPEWESLDETTLGERLAEMAEETDYPQVFEDTTGGHQHDHGDHAGGRQAGGDVPDAMLQEAEDALADADTVDADGVLEEAMELTRKRHEGVDETSDDRTGENADDGDETGEAASDGDASPSDDSETE
jgi:hypothetical protein